MVNDKLGGANMCDSVKLRGELIVLKKLLLFILGFIFFGARGVWAQSSRTCGALLAGSKGDSLQSTPSESPHPSLHATEVVAAPLALAPQNIQAIKEQLLAVIPNPKEGKGINPLFLKQFLASMKLQIEKTYGVTQARQVFISLQEDLVRKWAQGGPLEKPLSTLSDPSTRATVSPRSRIVRVLAPQWLRTIRTEGGHIYSMAFSDDFKKLITAGADNVARVWSLDRSGGPSLTIGGHSKYLMTAEFFPDDKTILTSSADGAVKISDANTGENLWTLTEEENGVTSAHRSPDGKFIATTSVRGNVKIWSTNKRSLVFTLSPKEGWAHSIHFSPSGRLLVSSSNTGMIDIWEVETGTPRISFRAHDSFTSAVHFSNNEKWLVTGSNDFLGRIWRVEDGHRIAELDQHTEAIHNAKFSYDDQFIATGSRDGYVKLWDAKSGRLLFDIPENFEANPLNPVYDVEFSPDRETLAIASANMVKFYSLYKNVLLAP